MNYFFYCYNEPFGYFTLQPPQKEAVGCYEYVSAVGSVSPSAWELRINYVM